MDPLGAAKRCELHVHIGGCLHAEDILQFAREHYRTIDWHPFTGSYAEAFGAEPDPIALIEAALAGDDRAWRRHFVVDSSDRGDFSRFQAKFNLAICVLRHLQSLHRYEEAVDLILDRHRREGVEYVEYRSMYMRGTADPEGFVNQHRLNAERIRQACGSGFEARYIPSIPRTRPLEGYSLVRRLLRESPELIPTIVGVDFCFFEEGFPPLAMRSLFDHLHRDNEEDPEQALSVVYHVGEVFFDKSLESAVRWCHQAAAIGSVRLGHATALGMDPAVAVARAVPGARRSGATAHEAEPAGERLDQIDYDLQHARGLEGCGIVVDADALRREREALQAAGSDRVVHRDYTAQRLQEVRLRQGYVLDQLSASGTVIETCPTSNLMIGAVPDPGGHPVHRFLGSNVDLVIGADDPGTFDSTLAAEVDWVLEHSALDAGALGKRLGNPRRFVLKRG